MQFSQRHPQAWGKTSRPTRAEALLASCVAGLAMLPAAALGGISLFYSVDFDHATFLEKLTIQPQNAALALLCALLLAAMLVLLGKHGARAGAIVAATATAGIAVTVLGAVWALSLHSHPVNDQLQVWDLAIALAKNDFAQVDFDYLKMYPHQCGMALFLEPLVRLFGTDPYPAFGLCNAACCGAMAAALCCLCETLGGDGGAVMICAVLCMLFLPLSVLSSFLYGTTAATAMALWALCGALRLCRGQSRWWWLAVVLLVSACILYNVMLIFALGAAGLLIVHGLLRGGRHGLLPFVLPGTLVLLAAFMGGQAAQWLFTARTGIVLGRGIPRLAWVVMGLTAVDTNSAAGGYNSYTQKLFWANGADTAATQAAALADLRAWLGTWGGQWRTNLAFLREKLLTEWLDPWFTALTVTYQPEVDTPGRLAALLCGGPLLAPATALLRTLRTVVYLAAAAGSLQLCKANRRALWAQGAGLCFFGSFLFMLAWENHSRYCLPYFLCLLPLAALGLRSAGIARKRGK